MKNYLKNALAVCTLLCFTTPSEAQPLHDANNPATHAVVPACSSCTNAIDEVYCLNADMVQLEPDLAKLGQEKTIQAVVYEADVQTLPSGVFSNYCGYSLRLNSPSPASISGDLPSPGTWPAMNNLTASQPDVAVGTYYDVTGFHYFVAFTYVAGNDIWVEFWDMDPTLINPLVPPPAYGVTPACHQVTHNAVARQPRIDILADFNYSTSVSDLNLNNIKYVIAWEETNAMTFNSEVHYAGGHINQAPLYSRLVEEGHSPDIAVVSNLDQNAMLPPYNHDQVYVTYIQGATNDLVLREYFELGGGYPHTWEKMLESNTSAIFRPRISAPVFYSYNGPVNEAIAVVTATVEDNSYYSSFNKMIRGYAVDDPTATPGSQGLVTSQVSDYTYSGTGPFFNTDCYSPMITGIGEHASAIYSISGSFSPYKDYSIEYYSTLTNHNANNTGTSVEGDYYAIDLQSTTISGYTPTSNDWYEVNRGDLQNITLLSSVDKNYIAVATSNNTGYDLLSAYYTGTQIRTKEAAFKYQFKPTAVKNVLNTSKVAIYPNPSQGEIRVQFPQKGNYDLKIKNLLGAVVYQSSYSDVAKATVSFASSLSAGSYTVHISGENVEHTEKITLTK